MSKKLKILYDPQMFDKQNYGGITRYFANLITGIEKTSNFCAELPLVYSTNYYIRNFPQLLNSGIGSLFLKKTYNRTRWNLLLSKRTIKRSDFDIFHATYYNPYFLENLKKPLVITVHDMIHENYPEIFNDAEEVISQKKKTIEAADLIIAISIFTKQELLRHYPQLESKIRVIYHGLPDTKTVSANQSLPQRYLLYVGDRYTPYKNFVAMVEAISPLITSEEKLHLICAGGGEFNPAELDLLARNNILQYTTQINASDAQMAQLYRDALLFIYPSIEEGFGFPILEAFKAGCPVACSNTSCLPEVGGNAVGYFNPAIVSSIRETVSALISNPEKREGLVNNGYEQLQKFTFQNCLDQTLDCYTSLIKS
ncbi:glycosyltransferase family 4 protein [Pedobacter cryoconitis]|uniref:Glycosyltransferase involved in cell wall biosynthesis n=1 Tax=Pedobacter cryoconitis TaxID=188932 RepID=A0A327S9W6_9SPHI|nr:glycosyltransferase family 1 protein [Pedobacter cryoconitis]RAJ25578.1 glycosyltransferase involved in cell wall biosynthesis [Pedobacter cryoconitis]